MPNVTIKFGSASITKLFEGHVSVGSIIRNPSVRAGLEVGNMDVIAEGPAETDLASSLLTGVLKLVPRPAVAVSDSTKVTVSFGTGSQLTRDFTHPTTVGQLLGDPSLRAGLGYGANVEGRINGIPVPSDRLVAHGDFIMVYDKACAKASAK